MPTRLIREGILASDRIEQLDWPGEVFYRRLLNKVDDHGLYDARTSFLRSSLYPLRVDRVREADISRWIAMCVKAGLIVLYEADGKPYLQVLDTRWQHRSEPKYPLPTENNCKQLQTPVHLDVDVVVSEVVEVPVGNAPKNGARHAKVDDSPLVIALPLRDGSKYEVRGSLVTELEPLYPNVDIPRTLGEMKGWLITNPDRLKTRRGAMKFIGGWLQREEEKHGG